MTKDPELALIDRILSGEQQLYAELVDRYQRYAFSITFRVLLHRAEAEEAAQDAFIKAFKHLADFNRTSRFSTWLYRIAFNTAISYKRKHRYQFQPIENSIIAVKQEADGNLEKSDQKKYLHQALLKLSDTDRTALTLFYWQELSLDEMAEIVNVPANTLKVRIHRARQRVADELEIILKKEALTL
jgi:RNA polymerase sigma-70 factor (ECF subfamily)